MTTEQALGTSAPVPPRANDNKDTHTSSDVTTLLGEPASKAWFLRPWVWAACVGLLLLAAGVWWWTNQRAAKAAPRYSTQAVTRGDLTLTVTANGTVQPTRAISIGSELSGTVLQVFVDVKDPIKKGQALVVLDTAKLRDQILRSKASLAAATAKVAQTAATVQEATATLGRLEEVAVISSGRVPSKTELDTGRATLARAVADNASARAGVNDARAALSTDETNLSKASVRAPSDGVILTRTVDPGNAVAASLQAVTLFTVAEDLKKLRLWVYVDEADVGTVSMGQSADFTVSAYPTRRYPAHVTRVGFGSTITDNVVTYLTYLDVDNSDGTLRPGMTANARIVARQRHQVLLVPNTALRFAPMAATNEATAKKGMFSGMGPPSGSTKTRQSAAAGASTANAKSVWVLRGETSQDVPVEVAVTPGISDGHLTEITSGDLKPGRRVITDQKSATAP